MAIMRGVHTMIILAVLPAVYHIREYTEQGSIDAISSNLHGRTFWHVFRFFCATTQTNENYTGINQFCPQLSKQKMWILLLIYPHVVVYSLYGITFKNLMVFEYK